MSKVNAGARCCFGATPLVGELPRSNGQTTAWPEAPPGAQGGTGKVNAGARCCFGATPLVGELPRSNGQTTAWPEAPPGAQGGTGKVNAGARCCFGATPLVGELPRSNGQTTAWPSAPSRALRVIKEVNAGPPKPINHNYAAAAPPRRPDPVEQHRAAKTNKPKLRRARFFGTHAPRDKENQPEKCRRENTPEPPMLFWRDPSRWRATP